MVEGIVGWPGRDRQGLERLRPVDDPRPDGELLESEALAVPHQRRRGRPVDLEDEAGPRAHFASLFVVGRVGPGRPAPSGQRAWQGPALRRSNTIFTAPRRPARGGMGDGVLVALERVARRDETLEARLADESHGELEGGAWPVGTVLATISVCAAELDLALPERGEVDSDDAWHADEDHSAAGPNDVEALLQGVRRYRHSRRRGRRRRSGARCHRHRTLERGSPKGAERLVCARRA